MTNIRYVLHQLQKDWILFYLKWAWNECLHLRTSEMSIDMGRRIVHCMKILYNLIKKSYIILYKDTSPCHNMKTLWKQRPFLFVSVRVRLLKMTIHSIITEYIPVPPSILVQFRTCFCCATIMLQLQNLLLRWYNTNSPNPYWSHCKHAFAEAQSCYKIYHYVDRTD